ncbi:MAG: hypothetical protein QX199_01415 [Methylococcaceae bacterium]
MDEVESVIFDEIRDYVKGACRQRLKGSSLQDKLGVIMSFIRLCKCLAGLIIFTVVLHFLANECQKLLICYP